MITFPFPKGIEKRGQITLSDNSDKAILIHLIYRNIYQEQTSKVKLCEFRKKSSKPLG